MITPSQLHLDVPLTNLTIAQIQSNDVFIADKVFPRVSVEKQSDKYYVWPRGQFNRIGDVKKLAPGTEVEEITLSVSNDNYFAEVFGLGWSLTEQALANQDTQLNVRLAATTALTQKMLLKRELDWISTYFTTGVWTTQYTGVSGSPAANQVRQWNDYTNSTPIRDVTLAKTAMYLASGGTAAYNEVVAVMTQDVYDTLVSHPDFLARLNGGATVTNTALITQAKVAEIFGVNEVLIVRAIQNTGKEGLADAASFVATKRFALFSRPKAPGIMVPASGYNFVWDAGAGADYGVRVNSYTGDHLRIKHVAEKLEVLMAYDMKVISADMGVYFTTVIA